MLPFSNLKTHWRILWSRRQWQFRTGNKSKQEFKKNVEPPLFEGTKNQTKAPLSIVDWIQAGMWCPIPEKSLILAKSKRRKKGPKQKLFWCIDCLQSKKI